MATKCNGQAAAFTSGFPICRKTCHAATTVKTGGGTAEDRFVYDECGMVCKERIRLLDEYAAATSAYRTAFAKVRPAKEAGAGLADRLVASFRRLDLGVDLTG